MICDPTHRLARRRRIAHEVDFKGLPVCGQGGNFKLVSKNIVGWFGYRMCLTCVREGVHA